MEEEIIKLNESNFEDEVEKSAVPVVVDFYALWCMPCKVMEPIFDEIARDYNNRVKFCRLNVEDSPNLANRYGIRSIPTLLIFKDGAVFSQLIGVQSKKSIEQEIVKALR